MLLPLLTGEEDHVKGIFLSILADSDHVVRMKMSTLVAVLFVDTSDSVKTSHEQAFAAVKQILGTSTGKQQDIVSHVTSCDCHMA